VHPGDMAGGFSDPEMTWLLYCAGAATEERESERGGDGGIGEAGKE